MGGQKCKTCQHPKLLEIHRLRAGETTLEALSDAFGLSVGSINRHLKQAQVSGHACRARWEAVACAPEAVQAPAALPGRVAAPSRPAPVEAPPARRRAIAGGPRPVQPVSPDNDRGGPTAGPIVPFRAPPMAPVHHQPKSSLTTNPQELALLQTIGYDAEQIVGLLGGGASIVAKFIEENHGKKRSVFAATRPQWANQCIRLRVDYLFSLRRQQQAAMDDRQHRVARQYNADIDRAMSQLFKTLELFGLVGPVDPSEVSKEGDDVRDMLQAVIDAARAKPLPELTAEELRFLEVEQSAVA